jgi:hypothetical protein
MLITRELILQEPRERLIAGAACHADSSMRRPFSL